MLIQQTAPPAPPIPALPARPGTSTAAPAAPGDAAQASENAQQALQNAQRALENAATAAANAELAKQNAGEPQIVVPPPYRDSNDIPKEVIPLVGIIFGSITAMVLLFPIIRFVTRMIERKADRSKLPATEVSAQLKSLQDSLDTMAIEIERISEAQRFQAKLLAERDRVALKAPSEG